MTAAQRTSANRMLGTKGQAITLAWDTPGTYDPATGGMTGGSSNTVSTSGAILPLDKARKVDGTNIVAGDETLLLSALDSDGNAYAEPPVGAEITDSNGAEYSLIAIDTLAPAGLAIMYDAVVRGHQ